jgi:hypothetical protein
MAQFQANLSRIRQLGGSNALISHLMELGEEGVSIAAELANGTEAQVNRIDGALDSLAPRAYSSLREYNNALREQVRAQREWTQNMTALVTGGVISQEQAQMLASQGMDFAPMVQMMVDQMNAGKGRLVTATVDSMTEVGAMAEDPLVQGFMNATQLAAAAAGEGARQAVNNIIDELQLLPAAVDDLRVQFGLSRTVTGSYGDERRQPQGQRGIADRPIGPLAEGGIVSFSKGTERHIAQMARPGEMRVWAEPETGGEAYIPLAATKRARSTAILSSVANQFGYALMPTGRNGVSSYADGGRYPGEMISGMQPVQQWSQPAPSVVTVPIETKRITQLGPIHGLRLDDVEREGERRERMSSLNGGV